MAISCTPQRLAQFNQNIVVDWKDFPLPILLGPPDVTLPFEWTVGGVQSATQFVNVLDLQSVAGIPAMLDIAAGCPFGFPLNQCVLSAPYQPMAHSIHLRFSHPIVGLGTRISGDGPMFANPPFARFWGSITVQDAHGERATHMNPGGTFFSDVPGSAPFLGLEVPAANAFTEAWIELTTDLVNPRPSDAITIVCCGELSILL
jgi:hypothetical protein